MILGILLGLSLAAAIALLRACYLWGVAEGELREYRRTPEERFQRGLEKDGLADKIVAWNAFPRVPEHPQNEWRQEVENDDKST